jgi:hypothetical protein
MFELGVVVGRLGVDWRWLPLAVLLVLDLGVASGLLLRGARRRITGRFAVGGGHTVPSVGGNARSSTASRLVGTTDISCRSRPVPGWIDTRLAPPPRYRRKSAGLMVVEVWRQRGHNEGTSLREDAGYDEKC